MWTMHKLTHLILKLEFIRMGMVNTTAIDYRDSNTMSRIKHPKSLICQVKTPKWFYINTRVVFGIQTEWNETVSFSLFFLVPTFLMKPTCITFYFISYSVLLLIYTIHRNITHVLFCPVLTYLPNATLFLSE